MRNALFWIVSLGIFLAACAAQGGRANLDVEPYLPPKVLSATLVPTVPDPVIEMQPSPTPTCTEGLLFVDDLTIPDGTLVSPGDHLDKQWKVKNVGSCNWNAGYQMQLIAGPAMEVPSQQALYPALSGTEVTIRMIFTAPDEIGIYRSAWQAYDVNQQPFGDPIYIEIEVVLEKPPDEEPILKQ
ncbi:MAG: hypothetical protein IMY76_04520 [Chloroflexi bacterium]|nr:hypothetical protein [Chloroflexota bacterium]